MIYSIYIHRLLFSGEEFEYNGNGKTRVHVFLCDRCLLNLKTIPVCRKSGFTFNVLQKMKRVQGGTQCHYPAEG